MMKCQALLFAVMLFFAASLPIHAQTPQYWDTNADAGAGGTGTSTPDGTWDTGITPNWNVNADGTGGTTTWTDGNDAIFSAGADASGDFTVTVSGAPAVHNITIEEGGTSAGITITGGQLTLTGTTPTITSSSGGLTKINSVIGGAGGLTAIGSGILELKGANTYSGVTTIGNGTVTTTARLGAAGAIPDGSVLTIANGVQEGRFQLNGFDETVRSIASLGPLGTGITAGSIAVGTNTLTINDQAGDVNTYQGLYTSSAGGKIIKNGLGTLVLNNFPTGFSGGEFILNSGTLGFGQNNVFGSIANNPKLTINGGTLLKTAGSGAAGSNWNIKTIDINGSFTLDPNGNNNVQILGTSGTNPDVTTTLGVDNPTITVPGGTTTGVLIFAGIIKDGPTAAPADIRGFTKDGTGGMTFTNQNTYRGVTTIKGGMLRVGRGSSPFVGRIGDGTGRIDLSGGTLDYNGSVFTAATDPRTITVANPLNVTADSTINYLSTTAGLGTTNNIEFLFTGTLSGTGGKLTFRNDGACTDNSNTCTFRPTFTNSAFSFGQNVEILNHTTVATRNTVLTLSNTSGTQTWSGNISGAGTLRRNASGGTTVLSGVNTQAATLVDGGTLTVSGTSATFGGGDVTVNTGNASISASVANAILDTAKLTLLGGGTAGLADTGFIALAAGINERVATLVLGAATQVNGTYGATGSGAANINNEYFSGAGIITVGPAGLPGDFNSDGKVDASDYATWRKNEVANAALPNDSGAVTQAARYSLWRTNFGNPPGAGSGGGLGSGAVPEPGTISLLICAVGSLVMSSRGSRRPRG
jgi:fibronectin-binding autotransporter adhesin